MPDKKTIIILISSAVAIPLTAAIIAAIRKQRPRSPQAITSLTQSPKENAMNIAPTSSATSQQQKEEKLGQWQQHSQQNSETIEEVTSITSVTTTAISNDQINDDREDITSPVALAIVPSSLDHSHINTTMTLSSSSSSPISKKERNKKEISVSDESKKARESLKEQIIEAIKEAKESAKGTEKQLKEESIDVSAIVDSRDSQILEKHVETLMRLFETTMTEIRKEPYDKQIKLLESYRDLLQTQSKVVNVRKKMASKLKAGS